MSRQFFSETVATATASGTAIANTTTETILMPNITIPANYLQDGRCLRATVYGSYGTTAAPWLQLRFRLGGVAGTALCTSGQIVTTSGTGGGASMTAMFTIEAIIQTRSNGASGTLMTNGLAILFTSTVPTAGTVTNYGMAAALASGATGGTTPVVATVDLTADQALSVTAAWQTANAANSIQALNYSLEALN